MSGYPNPAGAVERSVDAFERGDRDAARYWLDVARELRSGWRDKSQGYVRTDAEREDAPPAPENLEPWVLQPDGTEIRMTPLFREHMRTSHPDTSVCDHDPFLAGADVRTALGDATAVLTSLREAVPCAACGGETFRTTEGTILHRKTYQSECEYATVGR